MLSNEFVGNHEECMQLLEDYKNCFDVVNYKLDYIDKYLDQWKIIINYKRLGK